MSEPRAVPGSVRAIDLNADVGEGWDDAALIPLLTSASIACGAHAGDDATMRAALELAHARGIRIGAHPGFADRQGFGRRVETADLRQIEDVVASQVGRLVARAAQLGARVAYVKPHGALYHLAATDADVAQAVARAVRRTLPAGALLGLAGSLGLAAAAAQGLRAVAEAFPDRAYRRDGTLVARDSPAACIESPEEIARRAVAIALEGRVPSIDGGPIALRAETLCLHGDSPNAARAARTVRVQLERAGVTLAAFAP